MEFLLNLYKAYTILANVLLVTALLSILIFYFWREVSFFYKRVTYGLPIIGKSKRLAANPQYDKSTGWFDGEQDLCHDFMSDYTKDDYDGNFYDQCNNYLRKTTEIGRKSIPVWGVFVLFAIMMLEGFGFAFILSGYTIPGASEMVQTYGAWAIAFLIAIVLVWVTHSAGHQMYSNYLIRKVRGWYNLSGTQKDLIPDNEVTLQTTEKDDSEPNWQQILNRLKNTTVDVKPSYFFIVLACILILTIGLGATYVRSQALEKDLIQQHQTASEKSGSESSSFDPFADMSLTNLPEEVQLAQQEHMQKLQDNKEQVERSGGRATFAILATIFVFIQLLGIWVGYAFGFAGHQSKEAYSYVKGFKNRKDFENFYKRKKEIVVRHTQKYLKMLQNHSIKWAKSNNIEKGALDRLIHNQERTFLNFIHKENLAAMRHERDSGTAVQEHEKIQQSQKKLAEAELLNDSTGMDEDTRIKLSILGDRFNLNFSEMLEIKNKADQMGVAVEKYLAVKFDSSEQQGA